MNEAISTDAVSPGSSEIQPHLYCSILARESYSQKSLHGPDSSSCHILCFGTEGEGRDAPSNESVCLKVPENHAASLSLQVRSFFEPKSLDLRLKPAGAEVPFEQRRLRGISPLSLATAMGAAKRLGLEGFSWQLVAKVGGKRGSWEAANQLCHICAVVYLSPREALGWKV